MNETCKKSNTYKKIWLISLIAITFVMIALGAYTRLSGSGLSMVDWKIVMGIIPPIGDDSWTKSFQQYQRFPEFQLLRPNTTLAEYKSIFLVEYLHRLLGRLIGLAVLLPLIIFAYLKLFSKKELLHFLLLFLLVLVQGFVGWYMVKSGLVNTPQVSHFRLTLHLVLAIGFLCYTFILYKSLPSQKNTTIGESNKVITSYLLPVSFAMLSLQIIFGALIAGLKAGFITKEYPKMFGEWIPIKVINAAQANIFSNAVLMNFIHRHLGIIVAVLIAITTLAIIASKNTALTTKRSSFLLLVLTVLQPLLGIIVIITSVHTHSAILHQIIGIAMLLVLLDIWFDKTKQKWLVL